MAGWLAERRAAGDSIAQHGFQHQRLGLRPSAGRPFGGRRGAEFVGLSGSEAQRAVDAGWRVLKLAGIEPDGFVAPLRCARRSPRAFAGGPDCCGCTAPAPSASRCPRPGARRAQERWAAHCRHR